MNKYYVYWYHLPEHTDYLTQGYIGITGDLKTRDWKHKHCAKQGVPYKFYNAMRKYGDRIVRDILVITDKDNALSTELKLRPTNNIGWNTVAGGGITPDCTGKTHSEETKRKISETNKLTKSLNPRPNPNKGKKLWNTEERKRIGNQHRGKTISESHKQAIIEKLSGSNNYQAVTIKLVHKDNPNEIKEFSCIKEASEALNINYSSLRSQHRRTSTNYNRQGWKILHG